MHFFKNKKTVKCCFNRNGPFHLNKNFTGPSCYLHNYNLFQCFNQSEDQKTEDCPQNLSLHKVIQFVLFIYFISVLFCFFLSAVANTFDCTQAENEGNLLLSFSLSLIHFLVQARASSTVVWTALCWVYSQIDGIHVS